jgi:atypical dual specificity phosphatase
MSQPNGFSWIEKPHLAALARPSSGEELAWLRGQGLDVVLSLTESPLRRDWVNEAGLLALHVPMEDMEPPTQDDLDRCVTAIHKAHEKNMGVAVHCGAGMGRTGVVLACYLVSRGQTPQNAITRIRRLRPGSIETAEQEQSIFEFARRHRSA